MDAHLRRRHEVAPRIEIERVCRIDEHLMTPWCGRQALQIRPVETNTIEIQPDRTVSGRCEVHPRAGAIDAVRMADLPFALRDRLDERAVWPVVVKMSPPRPFAEPEKRSVFQP